MRRSIRLFTILIPALVLCASCDDPGRPDETALADVEIVWDEGAIGANMMPVGEPPDDYDRVVFRATFTTRNRGTEPYTGLEFSTADIILLDSGPDWRETDTVVGTLRLDSDWDGSLAPGEARSVEIRDVGTTTWHAHTAEVPCSQPVRIRVRLRAEPDVFLSLDSPDLEFGCVF